MRILDIRPGHEQEDTDAGRVILAAEIARPSRTIMIIRGRGHDVGMFAETAAARAAPFPWREAIWVKDTRIFTAGQEQALYAGQDDACAAILDLDDVPARWLATDASAMDIERAWLQVEQR